MISFYLTEDYWGDVGLKFEECEGRGLTGNDDDLRWWSFLSEDYWGDVGLKFEHLLVLFLRTGIYWVDLSLIRVVVNTAETLPTCSCPFYLFHFSMSDLNSLSS